MNYGMKMIDDGNFVSFTILNVDTNFVVLSQQYAYDDESEVQIYARQFLIEFQKSIPKGVTVSLQVLDNDDEETIQ